MKNKCKTFVTGERRALRFNLFHNSLYKQKIIKNKKKENKKFNLKKEISYYLNIFNECLNNNWFVIKQLLLKYNLF